MTNSYADTEMSNCPQCGCPFSNEIWLILDLVEHPDLVNRVCNDSLHLINCPHCKFTGRIDAPLLLYRASPDYPLIFSPAQRRTQEENQDDLDELVGLLRQRLRDEWQDEWLRSIPAVFRKTLRSALKQLRKNQQIQEAEKVSAIIPSEFRADIERANRLEKNFIQSNDVEALTQSRDAWQSILIHPLFNTASIEFRSYAMNDAGLTFRRLYRVTGQIDHLERAIDLWRSAATLKTPDLDDRAMPLSNLGMGLHDRYSHLGNYIDLEEAIDVTRQAVHLTSPSSPHRISRLHNLGLRLRERYACLGTIEDLDTAIRLCEEVVELDRLYEDDNASHLYNLGGVLLEWYMKMDGRHKQEGDLQKLTRAVDACQKAVTLTPSSSLDRSTYLNSLGLALRYRHVYTMDRSDLEHAIDSFKESVRLTPAATPSYAGRLVNLGLGLHDRFLLSHDDKDLQQACETCREACEINISAQPGATLTSSRDWGDWASAANAWVEAAKAYAYGLNAVDLVLRVQALRRGKQVWLQQAQSIFGRAAYVHARLAEYHEAIIALESGRARLLAEQVERYQSELELLPRRGQGTLYERYATMTHRLVQLESRELRREILPVNFDFGAEFRAANDELAAIIGEIQKVPGYEDFFRAPTFERIRDALVADDRVGIYVSVTSMGSLALIVYANGVKGIWLDLKEDELNAWLIKRDGEQIAGGYLPAQMGDAPLDTQLNDVLPLLGKRVMQPVAETLRSLNASDVTLIPCGRLALFPLHAAEYQVNDQTRRFMDEFTVTYTPSARALGSCRDTFSAISAQLHTLCGVGNPLPLPENANPLAYARPEVEEIAPLFGEAATLLYEQQATREALDAQLGKTAYLHLSCHGTFNVQDPLQSGVVLSNGEMLTVRDLIGGQRLRGTRLVVLSACQTAITDFNDLPEEAIGLPGGFVQAGVPGVVGTLWPVNDLSTMLLIVKFYESHLREGLAPAAALRKAQLWLRDVTNAELSELFARYKLTATDRPTSTRMAYEMASKKFREHTLRDPDERPYAHPYYWAPFVFYGV
jgi:CHAT domain-containing protein/tetratricopeptide (TPR) repeat protein